MRRKILIVGLLAAVTATTLLGLPLAYAIERLTFSAEHTELNRTAEAATIAVEPAFSRHERVELPRTENGTWTALYDRSGRKLLGDGPPRSDAVVREAITGQSASGSSGTALTAAAAVSQNERVVGVVRAASPRSAVWNRILIAWCGLLALSALAVGLTALMARRLAGRLAAPLERVARAARDFGDGDFTVRIAPCGIGEIDAVGQALDRSARRIGTLLRRERTLSADASHQLRTPLTALRLQLEGALDSDDPDLRPAVSAGLLTVDRIEHTIEELLALARDTHERARPVDIAAELDQFESAWRPLLAAENRALRIVRDRDLPEAHASATALRHILDVLLSNAAAHGAGTVTVRVREAGDALAIDVEDEGPGLRSSGRDIFERRSEAHGGHGIGLPLARALAEAEGARLVLRRAGPGPIFTLLVPVGHTYSGAGSRERIRRRSDPPPDAAPEPGRSGARPAGEKAAKLVVDALQRRHGNAGSPTKQ